MSPPFDRQAEDRPSSLGSTAMDGDGSSTSVRTSAATVPDEVTVPAEVTVLDEVTVPDEIVLDQPAPASRQERVRRTVERIQRLHERDVRTLLLGDRESRHQSAADLIDDNAYPVGVPVTAVVVMAGADDSHVNGLTADLIHQVLRRSVRRADRAGILHLPRRTHGVLLVPSLAPGTEEPDGGVARQLLEEATARWAEAGAIGDPPSVGVGAERRNLSCAVYSYRQAMGAARIAGTMPAFAPLASWGDLGVFGMLSGLGPDQLSAMVPKAIRALQRIEDGVLLDTLEAFLDNSGQVKATASTLYLHRASLYQRIRRIEEITGMRLDDGQARLHLHLGVKAARVLQAMTRPPQA
ncbi:PucR family transcriptional regulator [Euzebya rosea]|uniref:PucR family transcriptional regulator n=1 Tax=Euzebya rosea TaxID=2052804 RepID=UPI001476051D|nr:helix-turn-helix domain-containing protein [Euzebya rosea]